MSEMPSPSATGCTVEPVLVDWARADQAVGAVAAAEGADVLVWLALEPWDLLLDRSVGGAGGVPLDFRAAVGEDDPGKRVEDPGHRAVRARPGRRHLLIGAATEHEEADLPEHLQVSVVVAVVAVVDAAGPSGREPVDDAVAAGTKPSSDTAMCRISRRCASPLIL
jgi:hypothetical protein